MAQKLAQPYFTRSIQRKSQKELKYNEIYFKPVPQEHPWNQWT